MEPATGDFGAELRRLRTTAGMRQTDLVDTLHGVIARSTLANVESGRELPSPRLWSAIQGDLPRWVEPLHAHYESARRPQPSVDNPLATLAGPFSLVEARYVYTFREHHAPEEIIEVRQVRALKDGADGYVLRMDTDGPGSELDLETLWGGTIEQSVVTHDPAQTVFLHRLVFDRPLRKGETHSFALRSWITQEDKPPTWVDIRYTIPIGAASIHLNFLGPAPHRVWRFGPLAGAIMATGPELAHGQEIRLHRGAATARFPRPDLNAEYGIAWAW